MAHRTSDSAKACQGCRKVAEAKQVDPPCEGCGHNAPTLSRRFEPVMWLLQRMGRACRDGMGGISASNIVALLPALGVPVDQVGAKAIEIIEILTAMDEQRNG